MIWLFAHLWACGRTRGGRLGLRWGRRSCSDGGDNLMPCGDGGTALWLGQVLNILTILLLPSGYFL